jgi:hypothetical protein
MKATAESHPYERKLSIRSNPGSDLLSAIGQLSEMGFETRNSSQLVHIVEVTSNQGRKLANF